MERICFIWTFCFFIFVAIVTKPTSGMILNLEIDEEINPPMMVANIIKSTQLAEEYDQQQLKQFGFVLLSRSPDRKSSSGNIKSGNPYFTLGNDSSDILLTKRIDREKVCEMELEKCVLHLQVAIFPIPLYLKVIQVYVTINDINDNRPMFAATSPYVMEILEDAPPGSGFVLPAAFDPDSQSNGIKRYQINHPQSRMLPFVLHDNINDEHNTSHLIPRLILTKPLDRETEEIYEFHVEVFDGGNPPLSSTILLRVFVLDTNDNPPVFQNDFIEIKVFENITTGSVVAVVTATDRDSGLNGRIYYSLDPRAGYTDVHHFDVEPDTGEVYIIRHLDHETQDRFELKIIARDNGNRVIMTSSCDVIVVVIDVNDNAPIITLATTSVHLEMLENQSHGEFVAFVTVEDPDEGDGGRWSCELIGQDAQGFLFEPLGGDEVGQYKLLTSMTFDREVKDEVRALITCIDEGSPSLIGSKEVNMKILDENDNDPSFTDDVYYFEFYENNEVGVEIGSILATDPDDESNGKVVYSFTNHSHFDFNFPFNLDSNSGKLYAMISFDREFRQNYELNIMAEDSGSPRRSSTTTVLFQLLDLNDEIPTFSSSVFTFGTYENQHPGVEIGRVPAQDRDLPPFDEIRYAIDRFHDVFSIDEQTGMLTALVSLDREVVNSYTFQVLSWNDYSTSTETPTSSTTVTVVVADRNDNTPMIHFPQAGRNDTIQVSSKTPVGKHVIQIVATDADVGSNANLRYVVIRSKQEDPISSTPLFDVDPWSGFVIVTSDLKLFSERYEELNIIVHDEGIPNLSAVCRLRIIINSSLGNDSFSYFHPSPGSFQLENASKKLSFFSALINFPVSLMVLVSAMVGTLLVFLIVVVIFVICYNKRQRAKHARFHLPLCRPPDLMYIPKFALKKSQGSNQGGPDEPCRAKSRSAVKDLTFRKEKYFLTSKKFKNKKVVCDHDFFYYGNNSFLASRNEKGPTKQRNRLSLPGQFIIQDLPKHKRKMSAGEDHRISDLTRNQLKTFSHEDDCCWQSSNNKFLQQQQQQQQFQQIIQPQQQQETDTEVVRQHQQQHNQHHHHQQQQHQQQQDVNNRNNMSTNCCEKKDCCDETSDVDRNLLGNVNRRNSKHKSINTSQISYSSSSNETHTTMATRSTSVNSSTENCCDDNDEQPPTFTLATKIKLCDLPNRKRWLNYVSIDPPSEC